jgi:hypothetical protein
MKKNSLIYSVIMLAGLMVFSTSCQDEELNPYIEPLPGVHAFGQFAEGSSSNFILGELDEDLTFSLRWISIDNQLSVEKIDLYILFNEDYEDVDRNPRVARHGGDEGRFFTSIEGSALPANREDFTFSISQSDVRSLYDGITFDYDEDGTAVNVFDNDFKPSRAAGAPFISGDNFAVRWVLTTTDGLVYDSWSPSVCTELPGANCEINWILECGQVIRQPAQDYTITMADSFGDGWNGASLNVIADGNATSVSITEAEGAADTEVVSVPEGTSSVTFEYVSGDWDSEVSFTITTEKGNIIASVTNPSAGTITLNLCEENN